MDADSDIGAVDSRWSPAGSRRRPWRRLTKTAPRRHDPTTLSYSAATSRAAPRSLKRRSVSDLAFPPAFAGPRHGSWNQGRRRHEDRPREDRGPRAGAPPGRACPRGPPGPPLRTSSGSSSSRPTACGCVTASGSAASRSPPPAATRWTRSSRTPAGWRWPRRRPAARVALAGCAVVALGGYGRGELSPFSDVDLLFLHQGRAAEAVRRFVEQVLQLLWDVGLTVGHSFRTLAECVEEARGDLHSRTALAEARLVAGDTTIFGALDRALDNAIRRDRKSGEAFLESLLADVAERHARSGGAVCVQEPNVKEGVGGLRDLHAVLWVAQARHGVRGLAELDTAGVLSGGEHRRTRRAYDFLLRVRAEAHFATGRKTDVLTLDLQPAVAKSLGYEASRGLLASELFMRDYYRRASELHETFRSVVRRPPAAAPRRLFATLTKRRPARDFEVRDGRLRAKSVELLATGQGLLAAFAAAQAEGVPLSDELALAVRERLVPRGPRPARVARGGLRLRGPPALARARGTRAPRHARDGLPRPLPARVRPGELPRPARLLPPLHGGRAHAARRRGARRGRVGDGRRRAAVRPDPRRGRGRGPALPGDAAPRHRQGARRRPRGARRAHRPAGLRATGARRARRGGRGLPRRRPPRDVAALAAARPLRARARRARSPSGWGACTA